jgi:hypothetical protein
MKTGCFPFAFDALRSLPQGLLLLRPLRVIFPALSAPIEERLTWPVRVVLLGGGGHAATSYQIIKAPESHFSCSFREKEQENDQGEFEFRSNH